MAGNSGAASGSATSGTGALDLSANVLQRNKHASRDGNFVQPTLTKAKVATMALDATFKATFAGSMWASPLYLENGPGGKGVFFAVTTGNDVYALDETDGHDVWGPRTTLERLHLPTALRHTVETSTHSGILSTPVIDATLGPDGFATLYVAGAIGTQYIAERHEVHALSVKDGSERAGWPSTFRRFRRRRLPLPASRISTSPRPTKRARSRS